MAPCRPGTALFATLVWSGAIALAVRAVLHMPVGGAAADEGALLGARVRAWYRSTMRPFVDWFVDVGVSPDTLTYAQLVVSVWAAGAFWTGCIFLGGTLMLLAGTLDVLDGDVARRRGVAGPRGALIDSVVDRWAEAVTFLGLGAFFVESWVVLAVVAAAVSSLMVRYVRARAEGLGIDMRMGRVQRPERYVLLGFGAGLSSLLAHARCDGSGPAAHAPLAAALVLLAILSTWTAGQRMRHALAALAEGGAGR
jgi:CDP-diacylglycerol--glycerol-3-phosphate 3-phosphatidyltransferase